MPLRIPEADDKDFVKRFCLSLFLSVASAPLSGISGRNPAIPRRNPSKERRHSLVLSAFIRVFLCVLPFTTTHWHSHSKRAGVRSCLWVHGSCTDPAIGKQPSEPTAIAGEARIVFPVPNQSTTLTRWTIDRIGGAPRHQCRELWKLRPCMSQNCQLRVWYVDNVQIERFTSIKRNDLAVGQANSKVTVPVGRNRNYPELSRDAPKLARSRRVLGEKAVQRST